MTKRTKAYYEFEGSDVLVSWYKGLESNKADRAKLRRCSSFDAMYRTTSFWSLRNRFLGAGISNVGDDQLALVAGVLARVKDVSPYSGLSLPQAMAQSKSNGKPILSPLRFERLIQYEDREKLFRPLLNAMSIIDTSKLSVEAIANPLWFWGDKVRKEWAEEYFTKAL